MALDIINAAGMDEISGTYAADDVCFEIYDCDDTDDDTDDDDDDANDDTDDDTDDGGRGNRRPLPGRAVHFFHQRAYKFLGFGSRLEDGKGRG